MNGPKIVNAGQLPEKTEPVFPKFEFFGDKDLSKIPRIDYLYGAIMARGYLSLDVAEPKVGKTAMGLLEAVDIASGGKTLGVATEARRVLYFNAEDTQDVLDSRIAAILAFYGKAKGLKQADIADTLIVQSGYGFGDFILMKGESGIINQPAVDALEDAITRTEVDILYLEPLQDLTSSPESNEIFRSLGRLLRGLAARTNTAIKVYQHTRKMNGTSKATMDDARGGSALRGVFRFNRTLVPMSEADGAKFDVNHKQFFCYGDFESNLAASIEAESEWFEKVGIICPNGDEVVVVKRWQRPNDFENVTNKMAATVMLKAEQAKSEKNPYRRNKQADRYIGRLVAEVCGFPYLAEDTPAETTAKNRKAESLIKTWLDSEVLVVESIRDDKHNERPCVVAGDNNPLSVEEF